MSKKIGVDISPLTHGPIVDDKMATSLEGIFAAGNVVAIHDLVDYVTKAGIIAGESASNYIMKRNLKKKKIISLIPDENVSSVIPQRIDLSENNKNDSFMLQFRVKKEFENKIKIELFNDKNIIAVFKENYARPAEMIVINVKKEVLLKNKIESKELKVRVKSN